MGNFNFFAILSSVSNEGAFLPRSIKLRKSTDMPTSSANSSCVIRRVARISRNRSPNLFRNVAIRKMFPGEVCRSMVTVTTE